MSRKLTLLFVGSTDETAHRVRQILRDNSREATVQHVPDVEAMHAALQQPDDVDGSQVDLILHEDDLTPGSVRNALESLRASGCAIPLLVLSEADDAESAVDAIKAGARDWIITHHLSQRLLPAIEGALRDVRLSNETSRVAAELADSRQRYHDLAETLPQGVYELDREGHFTFVNTRGLELFGYTREDLERRPHVATLVAERDRARAMLRVREVLEGKVSGKGAEYAIVSGDGTIIPVLVYSAPITQCGEIVGLRGVISDLREIRETRHQLHESEERYRRLVETMGDGLATIDRAGLITYANQALASMLEVHIDHIIGRDIRDLLGKQNRDLLTREMKRRFTTGVPGRYEVETETSSGEPITLLITSTPLRDDTGEITASLGVITNITERRRAQKDLLRIKTALDNSSDAIAVTDAQRVPIYLNPAFVRISGYTIDELQKAGGARTLFANEGEFQQVFNEIEENDSFVGEFEGRHSSGRTFPVMGRIDAVRDARGELTGIVAVGTDITAQRRREEVRKLVRARLALINRLNQMLNAGESIDDIIAAGADKLCDLLKAHHVHILLRRSGEDGDELVLRYSNMPPEMAERLIAGVSSDRNLIVPLRPGTRPWKLYQDAQLMELREKDIASVVGEREQGDDLTPLYRWMEIVQEMGVKYLCLMPLTRGEHTMGHISVSRTEDKPLSGIEKALLEGFAQQMAVVLDKARAERELLRLNQLLEGIIENAAVWFSVIDENDRLIIWNHAAEQITGYSREQIQSGRHLMQMLYPDEAQRRQAYKYLDAAVRSEELHEIETAITRADGDERRIAWHLRSFDTAEGGTGLVVIGRDVSESHELQEQLQRVQRMDAVGTLAGGIAHDFNNVLTAIIGHADLLADESDENARIRWHAAEISQSAERASRLTHQLLAFSRRQSSKPQVVYLNRLIRDMEEMFRRVMPENIDLQLDLSSDLGYTEIDPSQVEQIVMNLVLNARDAMPDGGEVRVTTANAKLSDDSINELFDASPGEYVMLQVADTGIGMDEETEAHIFEPFFTTRHDSGGTGLGLSTVYGLVRQSKGAINVYSEVGRGTLFRIYLPRMDEAGNAERQTMDREQAALQGDERMIVVEDADSLRDLIGTILRSFGYTVYTAARGDEALALEEAHRGEIDLIITDVVMPEMPGTELADRLLEVSPDLKILFISGYPTERAISAEHTDGRFSFLQKPFSAVDLGRKIREMLD